MKLGVTGHRPNKLWGYDISDKRYAQMKEYFKNEIRKDVNEAGQVEAISGMALGVDILFAEAAIELKKEGLPVTLTAAIPFKGQEGKWPETSKRQYCNILSEADRSVTVCDGSYAAWKMQKRNEFIVDECDRLIAIWDGMPQGGTANCVDYARKKGKKITIREPKEFR